VLIFALIAGALVFLGNAPQKHHYTDARGSYYGLATVDSLDKYTERVRKSSSSSSTGVRHKRVTKHRVRLCPDKDSGIPCYSQNIQKADWLKLREGQKIRLAKGNIDYNTLNSGDF